MISSLYDHHFIKKLFQPVNNSPLVIFRMVYGFLILCQVIMYVFSGNVYTNFIEPPFTFTFIGFEFLQPLPGNGMYFYFWFMAFLGVLIALGAWYRFASIAFAILWTLQYLMQKSGYNNHYYLLVLLSWLMALVPANGNYSIDAARKPFTKTDTCPQWMLWLFAAQISIVYFFAAIAKLQHADNWFSGKFLSLRMSGYDIHPVYKFVYGYSWFPQAVAYSGFLFDLFIVPMLVWKRTRTIAFILCCLFHCFNFFTFRIGIFPFLSIAFCIFFYNPEKIRRIFFKNRPLSPNTGSRPVPGLLKRKIIIAALSAFLLLQVIAAVRSWFYPGDTLWTSEGYRMSWKMMLRTKSGTVHFKVIDPVTKQTWVHDPKKILRGVHVSYMASYPDITWQYAQRLKNEFAAKGFPGVEVYAISMVRINRSTPSLMIDSTIDLAREKWRPFSHSHWLTRHNQ